MTERDTTGNGTSQNQAEIQAKLRTRFGERILAEGEHAGQSFAVVGRDDLLEVLEFVKTDPEIQLDYLSDVTVVDHLFLEVDGIDERYAVVYNLSSTTGQGRFRIKAPVPEADTRVPTASGLWKAALWGEREAHDMFGIEFEGNPDLRRLLMPADYNGFPLRKDYPLRKRQPLVAERLVDEADSMSSEPIRYPAAPRFKSFGV